MPSIVEQIQRDALDPSISVASLLLRVKLAAAKLQLPAVEAWVEQELNGTTGQVPEYRKLVGRPMFRNPMYGWLPITGHVENISKRANGQSIAALEELLNSDIKFFTMPYPDQIAAHISSEIGFQGLDVALQFGRDQLVNIVAQVRAAVLQWAIELEKAGVTGNEFNFSSEERRRAQEANVTNIHVTNSGSIIGNLGTGNVARDISAAEVSIDQARDLVRQVRHHQNEIASAGADHVMLEKRLVAIEAAIAEGGRPSLLRELFTDLRNTVSGAAGNVVASGVLSILAPFVGVAAR